MLLFALPRRGVFVRSFVPKFLMCVCFPFFFQIYSYASADYIDFPPRPVRSIGVIPSRVFNHIPRRSPHLPHLVTNNPLFDDAIPFPPSKRTPRHAGSTLTPRACPRSLENPPHRRLPSSPSTSTPNFAVTYEMPTSGRGRGEKTRSKSYAETSSSQPPA